MRRLALAVSLSVALACRTTGDSPPQAALPLATTPSAQVPPAAANARLEQTSTPSCSAVRQSPSARLVLERTECFGYCPDYTVEVHGDGQVIYVGRQFVRQRGTLRWRIPQAQVDALFTQAACAHPDRWKSEYSWPITDNPTANVTVDLAVDGSPAVVVRDYPPCHTPHDGTDTPPELCELEQAIDTVTGSASYVRCMGADGGLEYCRR